jgi:hypothetical protein
VFTFLIVLVEKNQGVSKMNLEFIFDQIFWGGELAMETVMASVFDGELLGDVSPDG